MTSGLIAGSIALIGFGADSLVDGSASAVLVERQAARAVGVILMLIALYLTIAAVLALANRSSPETTLVGVVLSAASVLVLPILGRAKLRLAKSLASSALHADGVLSLAGAGLASATLLSLFADSALGWWWADAVAALLIAGTLFRESLLISRGAL